MTHCIKTGAYVFIENYGAYSPADLFIVKDGPSSDWVWVVRLNPESSWSFEPLREVTHKLRYFEADQAFFWNKELGIAVVPKHGLIGV